MQSVVELSLETQGADRTAELLEQLADKLRARQHELPRGFNTPYVNTIPVEAQTPYPGDWKTEVRLKSLMRRGVPHPWRNELANKLLSLQRPDGSWYNDADRWFESNPYLVTAYAVLTLQTIMNQPL